MAYALVAGVALIFSTLARARRPRRCTRWPSSSGYWPARTRCSASRALAAGAWRAFLLFAGIVVFLACWHAVVDARTRGVAFVLSLLLVVWLADIGAYFAGKALGRHKLAPSISPGKTWEGAIGGWLAVIVIGVARRRHRLLCADPIHGLRRSISAGSRALVALTVLVAFSVIGDLFESLLKRQAGVKDSSGLLPGHGGVLDRIDALLPVLPICIAGARLEKDSCKNVSHCSAPRARSATARSTSWRGIPDRFSVYALTAHRNGDKLVAQCLRFQPEVAVVGDAETAARVAAALRAAGLQDRSDARPRRARRRRPRAAVRHGRRGHRRRGGPCAHAGRRARRQAHSAREQGSAGHVRPDFHGRGARQRRDPAAGRQRAQRRLPVPAALRGQRSATARRRLEDHPDRVRRPVPHARPVDARRRHAGRSRASIRTGRWAARSPSIPRR